ncbi:MAG: AraC family transcriptional regulator, partial [Spirochaetales bacterium]|nr:AraC family transcriptional regulator [Spirochaetales bacterium]
MEYNSSLLSLKSSSSGIEIYKTHETGGKGIIKRVSVAPGIDVVFTDIELNNNKDRCDAPGYSGFEIFYCINGSFDAELENGKTISISDNQMMVFDINRAVKRFRYKEKRLTGISVFFIENEEANESLKKYLGENFVVNTFIKTVCGTDICPVVVPNKFSMDIFVNMQQCPVGQQPDYLRLKTLELYLICSRNIGLIDENKMKQTNRIDQSRLQDVVTTMKNNIEEPLTLNQLSVCVDMNPDKLKKLFKAVYKENISVYYRKLRLKKARLFLLNSDFSITEIANMIGYCNPSKFTSAFKNEYGY